MYKLILIICLCCYMSGCSTITAANEHRLTGHPMAGVSNNISAWYCLPEQAVQGFNSISELDTIDKKFLIIPFTHSA